MKRFDVIVAGAGPAGSELAYRLNKKGYNLLVLEREGLNREKPCGGGIQTQEIKELGLPPDEVIERRIRKADIHLPKKILHLSLGKGKLYSITVKRSRYDSYLQTRAMEQGVVFLEKKKVVRVEFYKNSVEVWTQDREKYISSLFVHAAGLGAKEIDDSFLLPPLSPQDKGVAYQVWIYLGEKRIDKEFPDSIHFFFDEEFLPEGYIWVFPKREVVAVGLGTTLKTVIDKKISLREKLREFISQREILTKGKIVHKDTGIIPLRFRTPLNYKRGIVLGDAGGFTNILHGGGIYQARKSACIASGYVDKFLKTEDFKYLTQFSSNVRDYFSHYERRWDERIKPLLNKTSFISYLASQDKDRRIPEALGILFSSLKPHSYAYKVLESKALDFIQEKLKEKIAPYKEMIEENLKELFTENDSLSLMLNYSLLAEAKRLRSSLVLITTEAMGGDIKKALPIALSYELAHTASLIHDDIIDKNPLRRGKESLHKRYGIEEAIVAGDALLIKAFQLISGLNIKKNKLYELITSGTSLGFNTCEGQIKEFEIQKRRDYNSLKSYLRMVRKKTGSLLEAATEAGAILGEARGEEFNALKRYGRNLGIAFQILDDSRDILSDSSKTLKGKYNDLRLGKPTPMLSYTLSYASRKDRNFIISRIGKRNIKKKEIEKILEIYHLCGAVGFTQRLVKRYVDRARVNLKKLRDSPAKGTLSELTDILGYWSLLSPD